MMKRMLEPSIGLAFFFLFFFFFLLCLHSTPTMAQGAQKSINWQYAVQDAIKVYLETVILYEMRLCLKMGQTSDNLTLAIEIALSLHRSHLSEKERIEALGTALDAKYTVLEGKLVNARAQLSGIENKRKKILKYVKHQRYSEEAIHHVAALVNRFFELGLVDKTGGLNYKKRIKQSLKETATCILRRYDEGVEKLLQTQKPQRWYQKCGKKCAWTLLILVFVVVAASVGLYLYTNKEYDGRRVVTHPQLFHPEGDDSWPGPLTEAMAHPLTQDALVRYVLITLALLVVAVGLYYYCYVYGDGQSRARRQHGRGHRGRRHQSRSRSRFARATSYMMQPFSGLSRFSGFGEARGASVSTATSRATPTFMSRMQDTPGYSTGYEAAAGAGRSDAAASQASSFAPPVPRNRQHVRRKHQF